MRLWIKGLSGVLAALLCFGVVGQTAFDELVVGSVTRGGIGVGRFAPPLPLPAGDWLVLAQRITEIKLDSGQTVPRYFFTLKSQTPDNPVAAIVLAFAPASAIHVNWRNNKCETTNPKAQVDSFDTQPSDILFLCAKTYTYTSLRNTVLASASGKNVWDKNNLESLIPHVAEMPEKALLVTLAGNRFREKDVTYNFFLRRQSDVLTDPEYGQQISAWTRSAGLALRDVLEGKPATFTQAPVGRNSPVDTGGVYQSPVAVAVDPAKARAEDASLQESLQLQRDREKYEKERLQLDKDKRTFEKQKLAALKEQDQKIERERADLLSRSKALCLRAYNVAASEAALRQFLQDFTDDACGQQAAARQKLTDLEEKKQKLAKDKDRDRQTKQEQARAMLGATVRYPETYKHCVQVAAGSACQPVTYKFSVKAKIYDIDLNRSDSFQLEVSEVTLTGVAEEAQAPIGERGRAQADEAFRQIMVGTKVRRSKSDLGLAF